jgi:hypothetical protein
VARNINTNIREDVTDAHQALAQVIGERDPIKVQRVLRRVMPQLVKAINGSWMLENLHQAEAARGKYKKDGNDAKVHKSPDESEYTPRN